MKTESIELNHIELSRLIVGLHELKKAYRARSQQLLEQDEQLYLSKENERFKEDRLLTSLQARLGDISRKLEEIDQLEAQSIPDHKIKVIEHLDGSKTLVVT